MKFSLSWLKEHLDTQANANDIAHALTQLGLEVESLENPADDYKNIVVGYVESCSKHPDADRLSVCMINDGSEQLNQVVCGAPNIRQGLYIAFARLNTIIPESKSTLKKGKIRGIESCGMACSAKELLFGHDSEGIMELDGTPVPGTPISDIFNLNNAIFDISITPNRSDCFNVRGIARDLAAFGIGTFIDTTQNLNITHSEQALPIHIHDHNLCSYFSAVKLINVTNKPSPEWLKKRIQETGQQSISALVDIANYVMFDLGQPLHVFDAQNINGGIHVNISPVGSQYVALNNETYTLDGDIIIADDDKILGLAGIKGGLHSGTSMDTKNIIIEAAHFNPINIANTGQRLKLFSDARTRFERGVDPAMIEKALAKAVYLIAEICGGQIAGYSTQGNVPKCKQGFPVSLSFLNQKAGMAFDCQNVKKHLEKIGCSVDQNDKEILFVTPPSWRHDIEQPEDILEEILRLHGYDHIQELPLPRVNSVENFTSRHRAKRFLMYSGLNEVYTFSMVDEESARLFGNGHQCVPILQPLNNELSVLRPSILPSLIKVAQNNAAKSMHNVPIFELAPVFFVTPQGVGQHIYLSGLRCHKNHEPHWLQKERSYDVFDVKSDVLNALSAFHIYEDKIQILTQAPAYFHPKRCGSFLQGNKVLAYFGEIHPKILKQLGMKYSCVGFEILLDNVPDIKQKYAKGVIFSPYQPVNRDFAFITDKDMPVQHLIKTIKKVAPHQIVDIMVFDVYAGDKLPKDKKSIALRLKIQAQDHTLTDAELLNMQNKIILEAKNINAIIRDGQT